MLNNVFNPSYDVSFPNTNSCHTQDIQAFLEEIL